MIRGWKTPFRFFSGGQQLSQSLHMGFAGGFQVFILFSNGSVYALCPVVPFGRYSFNSTNT
jgi:hypothetical protein